MKLFNPLLVAIICLPTALSSTPITAQSDLDTASSFITNLQGRTECQKTNEFGCKAEASLTQYEAAPKYGVDVDSVKTRQNGAGRKSECSPVFNDEDLFVAEYKTEFGTVKKQLARKVRMKMYAESDVGTKDISMTAFVNCTLIFRVEQFRH